MTLYDIIRHYMILYDIICCFSSKGLWGSFRGGYKADVDLIWSCGRPEATTRRYKVPTRDYLGLVGLIGLGRLPLPRLLWLL